MFAFIGVENAFSPFRSGGEARVGRSSPHLEGRNEVENRNEACVMEVAAMGSRAKLRTKEGGNRERRSLGWKAVKPRPLRFVSRVATGQGEKFLKTCEAARNIDGDEGETVEQKRHS